jgi:hypothetical protein
MGTTCSPLITHPLSSFFPIPTGPAPCNLRPCLEAEKRALPSSTSTMAPRLLASLHAAARPLLIHDLRPLRCARYCMTRGEVAWAIWATELTRQPKIPTPRGTEKRSRHFVTPLTHHAPTHVPPRRALAAHNSAAHRAGSAPRPALRPAGEEVELVRAHARSTSTRSTKDRPARGVPRPRGQWAADMGRRAGPDRDARMSLTSTKLTDSSGISTTSCGSTRPRSSCWPSSGPRRRSGSRSRGSGPGRGGRRRPRPSVSGIARRSTRSSRSSAGRRRSRSSPRRR